MSRSEATPIGSERSLICSLAANEGWAQCPDRTRRTAPGRAAGPGELEWHAERLTPIPGESQADRLKRAENAKRAWYQRLALKSAQSRRRRQEAA